MSRDEVEELIRFDVAATADELARTIAEDSLPEFYRWWTPC